MKFLEAMAQLMEGKKVRYSCWPTEAYLFAKDGDLYEEDGSLFGDELYASERWELFERPKLTIRKICENERYIQEEQSIGLDINRVHIFGRGRDTLARKILELMENDPAV